MKKTILIKFGKRVQKLRHDNGFSQEKLSKRSKLNRLYIGRIENGKQSVTLLSMKKLAKALNVEIIELVEGL